MLEKKKVSFGTIVLLGLARTAIILWEVTGNTVPIDVLCLCLNLKSDLKLSLITHTI